MALFIAGIVVGVAMTVLLTLLFSAKATLRIDHSNPEKDIYRLDLSKAVDDLDRRNYLLLHIDHNAKLTQE